MKTANVRDATSWFDVLITSASTQAAVMRLTPDSASSESSNTHQRSDQVLLVLQGVVDAEVGEEKARLGRWDVVVVPAGTQHRFTCAGSEAALTLNVYGPPAY